MKNKETKAIKVFLDLAETRIVRLAAANRCITASAFIKEAGIQAAASEMRAFTPPTLESSQPKVRRKKSVCPSPSNTER